MPDESSPRRLHAIGARAELIQALGTLPPRRRAVLVLRYFEDLREAQVAERSALRARADEPPAGAGAGARSHEYRPRTRDLRPPVAAGVLTTAAAAAAAVVLVDLGPSATAAFAGWSATPTRASTAQVAGAKDACQSRLGNFSTNAGEAMKAARVKSLPTITEISKMTPVLTDTRGPFTFVIYSGPDGANGTCISGPSFTSVSTRSGEATGPPAGKIVSSFEAHTAHGADAGP